LEEEEKMTTRNKTSLFLAALIAGTFCTAGMSEAGMPKVAGPCQKCHTEEANAIRGNLGKVSPEFSTMQVKVGNLVWIVKYNDKTTVIQGDTTDGADEVKNLPGGKEVLVSFSGDESRPLATEVAVKQPFKVPENQKITNDEIAKLVSMGPEQGKYTLIDARPAGAFLSGHIPTAISLPFDSFKENYASVLPRDKDRIIVFYCGGPT
jgi:hypothetical protein